MQQPSTRQQELERLYNSRRGHVPQISISDDNYHVTEALGSYYGDEPQSPQSPSSSAGIGLGLALDRRDPRPLSYVPAVDESIDNQLDQQATRKSRRNGSYFEPTRTSPTGTLSPSSLSNSETVSPLLTRHGEGEDVIDVRRPAGSSTDRDRTLGIAEGQGSSPTTTPPLNRRPSTDTAIQPFPLNDIDYESSPAAVAQELSNLQAIRRMSMNVDAADPDLPTFGAGGLVPTVAPSRSEDENDAARLFWVPARLHPELAPKEFKTFIEDRVDKIRRRSGDADALSPDLERSGSASSSLRRKKSMLSHQIDTKGSYEDGADRLERKRSKGMSLEAQTRVNLSELESLVNDPAQLMRRMSLDTTRRSLDSGVEISENEDMPILPPVSQSLKRSTRTTYRKGSLKKGERVPFAKRIQNRHADSDAEELSTPRTSLQAAEELENEFEPEVSLSRAVTEPPPPPQVSPSRDEFPPRQSSRRQVDSESPRSSDDLPASAGSQEEKQRLRSPPMSQEEERPPPPRPQHRQFQSRLASGPGRTTAQLPGYNNPNPLPHIIETLPDGTRIPVNNLGHPINDRRASSDAPDRKRSHELARPFQRGGAHSRPVPGREHQRSSTLDDLSSHPTALPGSGGIGTDSLTIVPTFEDRKYEKKDSSRKSTWKWPFGGDDSDEKKAAKEEKEKAADASGLRALRGNKGNRQPAPEKARLDVLQNSIEGGGRGGHAPSRGRESLVLNREDLRLEDEQHQIQQPASKKKDAKRAVEPSAKPTKEPGLLSSLFGSKKKSADAEDDGGRDRSSAKDKKKRASKIDARSGAHHHGTHLYSPDLHPMRFLKPDIDYNWTRFSILEERAIYRMAHIKLANPRRALYSQVLLSNFMYSYLAKVQMMHPQVQIPAAHQRSQNRGQQSQQQQQQQKQEEQAQQQQPAEFSQYQQWQQQQDREENTASYDRSSQVQLTGNITYDSRASNEYSDDDPSAASGTAGYETPRSSEEYDYEPSQSQQQQQQLQQQSYPSSSSPSSPPKSAYRSTGSTTTAVKGGSYSVAGTHDYLGYPKDGRPFDTQGALWDEDEDGRKMDDPPW